SEAPGFPPQGQSLLVHSANPEALDLWLDRGLELRGRVVDLFTGEPIADALLMDAGQGRELLHTGPQGTFDTRVSKVPGYAFADVHCPARGYCGVRLAFEGAGDDGLALSLVRTTSIEGVVRDQSRRPVQGARVWLSGPAEFHVRAVQD